MSLPAHQLFVTPWAFIRRDFQQALSYKLNFFGGYLGIPFLACLLYFLSGVVDGAASPFLKPYGGNYFAFLLIGVALTDYAGLGLMAFSQSIRDSQMMGTLEIMLLSPTRLPALVIYSSLGGYIFTSFRFLLYLVAAVLLFGLDLGTADLVSGGVVLLASIVCFAGVGITMASVILVVKQARFVEALLYMAFFLLGGVMYPLEVLPDSLRSIAQWLPITHALSGMRQALLQGASLRQVAAEILALLGFSAVLFPLGLLAFHLAVQRVKMRGTLGQY